MVLSSPIHDMTADPYLHTNAMTFQLSAFNSVPSLEVVLYATNEPRTINLSITCRPLHNITRQPCSLEPATPRSLIERRSPTYLTCLMHKSSLHYTWSTSSALFLAVSFLFRMVSFIFLFVSMTSFVLIEISCMIACGSLRFMKTFDVNGN